MRKRILSFFISGCWLLVSSYWICVQGQGDETLTLLTYYPAPYGIYQTLEVLRQDGTYANLMISQYRNTNIYPMITFRKADNTLTSPGAIDNNERLGAIVFGGYDGAGFQNGAEIYAIADANWSGSQRGTELHFMTRNDNEALSDRMIIKANGRVGIGTSDPLFLLHVSSGEDGHAQLGIEADTDNDNENNNPRLIFRQDGGDVNSFISLEGDAGTVSPGTLANAFLIGSQDDNPALQFITNDEVRMTISTAGSVGIGTEYPSYRLHVIATGRAIDAESSTGIGVYGISTDDDSAGIYGRNNDYYGIEGRSTNSAGTYGYSFYSVGVYGLSSDNAGVMGESSSHSGVYGESTSSNGVRGLSTSGYGVRGESTSATGVFGRTDSSSDYGVYGRNYGGGTGVYGRGNIGVRGEGTLYDFYGDSGNSDFGAFTGAHDVIVDSSVADIIPGMLVVCNGECNIRDESLSSTLPVIELSSKKNDNRIFGVFIKKRELEEDHWYEAKDGQEFGIVNAVGEGLALVTDINGPVQNGDYITTSDIHGYGQRQDDDVLHSYTLGKAIQSVDWDRITDTIEFNGKKYKKCLIAVTYHCG